MTLKTGVTASEHSPLPEINEIIFGQMKTAFISIRNLTDPKLLNSSVHSAQTLSHCASKLSDNQSSRIQQCPGPARLLYHTHIPAVTGPELYLMPCLEVYGQP